MTDHVPFGIPEQPMRGAVNKTSERPDDIPQDVWDAAIAIGINYSMPDPWMDRVLIARAIMADRQSRAAVEPVAWLLTRGAEQTLSGFSLTDEWRASGWTDQPLYAKPASESVATVIDWLETELSAIDCVYRGSPTYDHDAY